MTLHQDNAVEHYRHLREQDVSPRDALAHTAQRFGIPEAVLRERVNGKVAQPKDTRAVLAEVREHLASNPRKARDTSRLLRALYEAVTGEHPVEPEAPVLSDSCAACEDSPAGQRWLCPHRDKHAPVSA